MKKLALVGVLTFGAFGWSVITSTVFPVKSHSALHFGTLILGAVSFWISLWKISGAK